MATFTLCFAGTDCWTDEGIKDRSNESSESGKKGSDPAIYGPMGYIPVRVYADITESRTQGKAVMPGPGCAWGYLYPSLWVPCTIKTWGGSGRDTGLGESMWDLAGHAAAKVVGVPSMGRGAKEVEDIEHFEDLQRLYAWVRSHVGADLKPNSQKKPPSHERYRWASDMLLLLKDSVQAARSGGEGKVSTINLIGHSRGAVAAIMCTHELEYLFPEAEVNVFAIDPVPGPFTLSEEMCTLAPTVANYVGVYALDETSGGFNGVVPRPFYKGRHVDPLKLTDEDSRISIPNYHLVYAPGRHGTVAGNKTSDGGSSPSKICNEMAAVGHLIGYLARACMRRWGSDIQLKSGYLKKVADLKTMITNHADDYRGMRKFTYYGVGSTVEWLTLGQVSNVRPGDHWTERGVYSVASGTSNWSYLEDAIGLQDSEQRRQAERSYMNLGRYWGRMQQSRAKPGLVKWEDITAVPYEVFKDGIWDNDQ